MSGHSKWSSIKHKKALTDAKKGQQFTKVAREITIAARQGQIVIDANGRDPDEAGLDAIDLGANDARVDGKTVDVVTDPAKLEGVQQSLKKKGYKIDSAEVTMNASQVVSLDEARAPSVLRLLDALEEHDDVQSVYSNIDVPADVMERISERV